MNNELSNKLQSFLNTLATADKDEYAPIWTNQSPLAFGELLAEAREDVKSLGSDGAAQSIVPTGDTKALKDLRESFEETLHPLARSLFRCFTKLGNAAEAAKADLTPSDLRNARALALAGFGETVLDLADELIASTDAAAKDVIAKYDITEAAIAPVNTLWEKYSVAVGAPAGARARRKALTEALPAKFAATEEKFAELDDLVVRYNGTKTGKEFVAAWFNARRVADLGRRAAKPAHTSTPNPEPAK